MAHVEPAHLVELALGNGVSSDDADALRHIALCRTCREELTLMARVVAAARGVEEADLPVAPPQRVWRRIAQEVSRTGEAAPPPVAEPVRRPRAVKEAGRRAVRSPWTGTRTSRRVLGLLVGTAVVVRWAVRARSARRAGRGG
ncbi:hypothetical protein OIE73_32255 [Streptomyces hirsutus]|uniref:Zinc-finger domain-containing protein n=1 Tax=Streptomyces hirsutus TaxID=35620 RepID=A0ABZ1GUQ7_9ACTN|nr:hypothetical protein [Streptomyces hirsutus]WSD09942.1 hypothetical protein OIE73_32255 [Streptomyces hirsutus]